MKVTNHYAQTLRGIVSNPFYKKLENQHEVLKSDRTIGTIKKQDKTFLPFMDGDTLLKLYLESQVLQTGDLPKRLVLFQQYLIWLEDQSLTNPTGAKPSQIAIQDKVPGCNFPDSKPQSDRKVNYPVVLGYCSLKGYHVDSNDTVDSLFHGSESPEPREQSPNKLGFLTKESGPMPAEEQAPSPIFVFDRPSTQMYSSKSKYFFKFTKNSGDQVAETLFFEKREQQEIWRSKLAAIPVFFGDFENRFKTLAQISKEGKSRLMQVSSITEDHQYVAKIQKLPAAVDTKEIETVKAEFLQESSFLIRLRSTHIASTFKELHLTRDSCVIVQEELDGILFSDWYSDIWCFELGDVKDATPILTLLLELTLLLVSLNSHNIALGNLSKESMLVQTAGKQEGSPHGDNRRKPQPRKKGLATILESAAKKAEESAFREEISKEKSDFPAKSLSELESSLIPSRRNRSTKTSIYSKRRFYLLSLAKAVDTTIDIKPKSKRHLPDTTNPTDPPGRYTTFSRRHGALSSDIFNLGIIFYEILFGVDIKKALQQNFGLESEFVSNLVERPHQFIFSREPLYEVDQRLIEMLAWMLFPDPTQRPSIREVYSAVEGSLMDGGQPAPKQSRGSKRHTTIVSRVSVDTFHTPLSNFHRKLAPPTNPKDPQNPISPLGSRRKVSEKLKYSELVSQSTSQIRVEEIQESVSPNSKSPPKMGGNFSGMLAISTSFVTSRAKAIEALSTFSTRRACKRKLLLGNIQIPIPPQTDRPVTLLNQTAVPFAPESPNEKPIKQRTSTRALEFAHHRNSMNSRMLEVFRAGREQFRQENKPKEIELANYDSLLNVPSDIDSRKRSEIVRQLSAKLDQMSKKSGPKSTIILKPRGLTLLKGKTNDVDARGKLTKNKDGPSSQTELEVEAGNQDKGPKLRLQFATPGALTISFLRTDGSRASGSATKLSGLGINGYSVDHKSSRHLRKSLIVASKPLANRSPSQQFD